MRIEEVSNVDNYTKFEELNAGAAFKLWDDEETDIYIKLDVDCVLILSSGILLDGEECKSFRDADTICMHFGASRPRLYDTRFGDILVGEVFVHDDKKFMKLSDNTWLFNLGTHKLEDNSLMDGSIVIHIPDYKLEMSEVYH